MKIIPIIGIVGSFVAAIIPPLDWMTYTSVVCVAINAFFLGLEVGAKP